jgi:hypothetical protein
MIYDDTCATCKNRFQTDKSTCCNGCELKTRNFSEIEGNAQILLPAYTGEVANTDTVIDLHEYM